MQNKMEKAVKKSRVIDSMRITGQHRTLTKGSR